MKRPIDVDSLGSKGRFLDKRGNFPDVGLAQIKGEFFSIVPRLCGKK
jgi:hypothetical protein